MTTVALKYFLSFFLFLFKIKSTLVCEGQNKFGHLALATFGSLGQEPQTVKSCVKVIIKWAKKPTHRTSNCINFIDKTLCLKYINPN